MLAEPTLARPYARAAFDLARSTERVSEWSQALTLAAAVVRDEEMGDLIDHPQIDDDQMVSLFEGVLGDAADASFKGFLRVLLHYRRLALLPAIAEQFEQQRRASEQRLKVSVISAVEMQPDQLEKLAERLKSRFGREIEMETEVDSELIGGLIVRAGDKVIDASVRGRLERLENSLVR
jgi:F-type H+-transporting ATPase subunit delta